MGDVYKAIVFKKKSMISVNYFSTSLIELREYGYLKIEHLFPFLP